MASNLYYHIHGLSHNLQNFVLQVDLTIFLINFTAIIRYVYSSLETLHVLYLFVYGLCQTHVLCFNIHLI